VSVLTLQCYVCISGVIFDSIWNRPHDNFDPGIVYNCRVAEGGHEGESGSAYPISTKPRPRHGFSVILQPSDKDPSFAVVVSYLKT
jgi:hypothetical protein